MSAKERAAFRRNAEIKVAKPAFAVDARRILEALDSFEGAKNDEAQREVTGLLSWEKHRAGIATFQAFHGEERVGRIFKRVDHTSADKDVYSVEILGVTLPKSFQHIRDARDAGERAFIISRS